MGSYLFHKTGDQLAGELLTRVDQFQNYVIQTGIYYSWYQNKRFYENRFNTGFMQGPDILDIGEQGELKTAAFNHFRNILRHMLNALTAQVPAFEVSAQNTDLSSRRASRLGKEIINYYFKVKRFSNQVNQSFEYAIVYGDGYLACQWDPMLGQPYASSGGVTYTDGDFQLTALSPTDVFFDITKKTKEEWSWVMFRRRKNKYDLAAAFPEHQKEIEAMEGYHTDDKYITLDPQNVNMYSYTNPDDIYLYSAYHKPTESMPKGKYILFCGSSGKAITLYEGNNLYGQLPVFPLSPGKYLEQAFGFTEANCLRTPQEIMGMALSSQVTNLSAFGVANVWSAEDMEVQQLTDGMNLIKTAQKPEVLQLFQDNPSLLNTINSCERVMETLSGQNAVVRGNVQDAPNLKSGVAISLVQASAQSYNQALEGAAFAVYEDLATFILETLQKVATTERVIEIAGKSNKSATKTFFSKDLKGSGRVTIDRINPVAKTPAGRAEWGMEFLKIGVFGTGPSSAQKVLEFTNTGNLNAATESEDQFIDFTQSVKEALLKGEVVPPIPGINHQFFIKEIHSILLDLDILQKPENANIVQNVTNLLNGQMMLLRNGDEVTNLIYGGQAPTPPIASVQEVPGMMATPSQPTQPPAQAQQAPAAR